LTQRDELFRVPVGKAGFDLDFEDCPEAWELPDHLEFTVDGGKIYYVTITGHGAFLAEADPKKPKGGNGEFALM
jgi:hypothetical protein